MRIAILSPCWFAVPPARYGGIEAVVALLADGLADAGHETTLVAAGGSRTRAKLLTTFDHPPSLRIGQTLPELTHALACYTRSGEFDVINDHSGLLAAALSSVASPTPVCHTVHGPLDGEAGPIYEQIAQADPELRFISLSENQRRPLPHLPWLATCHNALDLDDYPYTADKDDYLLFLGRLAPEKGAAAAVRVARHAGMPLKLAGKMHDAAEKEYFEAEVEPMLGGGIEWLGEVSHDEKIELLRRARLTLFPITWEEPFGLVMIESMACGTPVLATRWGAVPEVIGSQIGGLVVDDEAAMLGALEQALALDGAAARADMEARFSPARMVAEYVAAYEALLAGT